MRIFLARSFVKGLRKLSPHELERFKERRDLFLHDPFNPLLHNHKLHGKYVGHWSINITGDCRAIYRFIDSSSAEFVTIGTHSALYE